MGRKQRAKRNIKRVFKAIRQNIETDFSDYDEDSLHFLGRIYYRRYNPNIDPSDLGQDAMRRATTNYLRHQRTNYDAILNRHGMALSGIQTAELKHLVNIRIWGRYPFLNPK